MFTSLSPTGFLYVALGTVCLYLLIIGFVYGRRLLQSKGILAGVPIAQANSTPPLSASSQRPIDEFPPLIDKPADHPSEQAGFYRSNSEEPSYELLEDNGYTTLLKEAEKVVEKIQHVVDNIASRPANPDEVFSKVKEIVSQYGIFQETEYFDAINNFISITVKRDCDLELSQEDLHALWYAQAA